MEKKAHNPGLSPRAWDKLHKMLAATNIKYREEIAEGRRLKQEGEKKVG